LIIVYASFLVMMLADDDSAGRQARNRARGADLAAPHLIDLGGISTDGPDDPAYITDMAQMFKQANFAFESYFDSKGKGSFRV
jgi:hypothetical protein